MVIEGLDNPWDGDPEIFDIVAFGETYAGTAQRYSQRLVVSEAVARGWDLCTADVEKAFLQGVTYEELSKLTGEPMREVNFQLPMGSIPILQKVAGFAGYDPRTEVCHCDKPGTGLVDAPRAFSLKLAEVTQQKCGMKSIDIKNKKLQIISMRLW